MNVLSVRDQDPCGPASAGRSPEVGTAEGPGLSEDRIQPQEGGQKLESSQPSKPIRRATLAPQL